MTCLPLSPLSFSSTLSSALLFFLIRPSCLSRHINRPKSSWQLEMNLCSPLWPLLQSIEEEPHTHNRMHRAPPCQVSDPHGARRGQWICQVTVATLDRLKCQWVGQPWHRCQSQTCHPLTLRVITEDGGEKKRGEAVGCRGPGAVSLQSGPVVSEARCHFLSNWGGSKP